MSIPASRRKANLRLALGVAVLGAPRVLSAYGEATGVTQWPDSIAEVGLGFACIAAGKVPMPERV
ncbi:MAG TPA: hypothetical protein PKY77_22715 [Phycisphaerae bacterium]|nr:hypothetical protein [Phycisphaerae bacterium]HRY71441.1 hypothetical protein [Phycisphaerae bacterium]HSA27716.1 hypothetical protein [Phycisphaerae bacterium]